ncbi:unnamed protein product [Sympodiomycopsis kandeliae]
MSSAATTSKIAVVTGANQGIGYGISRRLATLYSGNTSNPPLTLYFTSRNIERGQASLQELIKELSDKKILSQDGGLTTLKYHQLDIDDENSRLKLRDTLKNDHSGFDILINNAGIALNGFDSQVVKDTLYTDYYATKDLTELLIPLLRKDGRVVSLASMAGKLHGYSPEVTSRFEAVKTTQEADQLMQEFQKAVDNGTHSADGWVSSAYKVAKAGLIALHNAWTLQYKNDPRGLLINSCCPGYVSSRMTKHKGVKTLDEGAATPVVLALDDIQGKSGTFWENSKESSWK